MALNFKGKFTALMGAAKADVSVNLVQFKQDKSYVLYAPALEVYGYGRTIDEAKESFVTSVEEFIRYTLNKNTLKSELKRLGWKVKGTKNKRTFKTPDFAQLLVQNDNLIDIMNTREVRTYQTDIPMAIPA